MPVQDSGAADHGGRDARRPGFLRAVGPADEPDRGADRDADQEHAPQEQSETASTRQDGGLGIIQALDLPSPPAAPAPAPFVTRPAPAPPGAAPRHAAPWTEPDPPASSTYGPDSVSASREIFSALGIDRAAEEAARGKHAADSASDVDAATERAAAKQPVEVLGGDAAGPATDVSFAPRTGTRTIVGLVALVALAGTGYAAYLAYEDPRFFTIGIAGTLLVVTLVLYAVRASSTPTRLAIRGGQLIVTRGSARETFDLTSRYTRVEIVGKPGRRGWKVLFGRFGRDPFVVDASLVDPRAFDEAVRLARSTEWQSRAR